MSGNWNYSPCIGCKGKTQSPSGYCTACRTNTCACGVTFMAWKFGVKKCHKCRVKRSQRARAMGHAEALS